MGLILPASACLLAGTVLSAVVFWPAVVPIMLLWAGLLAFFRDPERRSEAAEGDVLSPADGVVRDVAEVEAPAFIEGPAVRIGIFMSLFDVHVNRAPATGTVRCLDHVPGSFRDARSPAAALTNEHCLLGLKLDDGHRLLIRQVAGLVARRIVCDVSAGDHLRRGQRFGMIRFGSRVELYLPVADQYLMAVRAGDRVKAGQTVLASLIGRGPVPADKQSQTAP
jgi:phosphatidylserine decarboxylase